MMAAQRAPVQVIDERQVAVRAAQALAAVAAQDEGRRSAPIDEQDRLLAPPPQRAERLGQRGREDRPIARRPAPRAGRRPRSTGCLPPGARRACARSAWPPRTRARRHEVGRRASRARAARRRGRHDAGPPSARRSAACGPTCSPPSCSSSTTISDGSSGAKTAVRVPTTTRASPRRIAPPLVVALPGREARNAGRRAGRRRRDRSRSAICGTRLTSGTSTIADPPSPQRLLDRGEVDVGLARRGDALEQELAARAPARRSRRGRRRCSAASSWRRGTSCAAGGRAGRARRCATRAPRGPGPRAAEPAPGGLPGSMLERSASSGIVDSPSASASRMARWTGARRGGSASPSAARGRRGRDGRRPPAGAATTRRGSRPERRRRSSQAARPRRGARRWRLASPILASVVGERTELVRERVRGRRRPSGGGAATRGRAAASPPASSRSARGSRRRSPRPGEQVGRQHRLRDDRLDVLQARPARPRAHRASR